MGHVGCAYGLIAYRWPWGTAFGPTGSGKVHLLHSGYSYGWPPSTLQAISLQPGKHALGRAVAPAELGKELFAHAARVQTEEDAAWLGVEAMLVILRGPLRRWIDEK